MNKLQKIVAGTLIAGLSFLPSYGKDIPESKIDMELPGTYVTIPEKEYFAFDGFGVGDIDNKPDLTKLKSSEFEGDLGGIGGRYISNSLMKSVDLFASINMSPESYEISREFGEDKNYYSIVSKRDPETKYIVTKDAFCAMNKTTSFMVGSHLSSKSDFEQSVEMLYGFLEKYKFNETEGLKEKIEKNYLKFEDKK